MSSDCTSPTAGGGCLCGVYAITNTLSGRRYVGSSVNIEERWRQHRRALNEGRHHCRHLLNAWQKYGRDAFEFSVLDLCAADLLVEREQYWMDTTRASGPLYNSYLRAASPLGCKRSEETRAKIGAAMRGKKMPPRTPEHLARISAANKGKGHPLSAETRAKMSLAHTGRKMPPLTPEHREKIAAASRGRNCSAETRARISAANKGRTHSPETCAKWSALRMGTKRSDETRARMSAAHKARYAKISDPEKASE